MKIPLLSLRLALVFPIAALGAQQAAAQPAPEVEYAYLDIYSQQDGHRFQPTVREECRSIVFDSEGAVYTVGVQSNDVDTRNATRQFISLGRWQGDHWTSIAKVNERDGYVYNPAAAADGNGGLWIAWAEFNAVEQDWDIYARHWDGAAFGPVSRLSTGQSRLRGPAGPDLRPTVAVRPDGAPLVAWESARKGAARIAAASLADGKWSFELLTADAGFNFRPNLAAAADGTVWLAFDRWMDGDYDVYIRALRNGRWSAETAFFASPENEQRPMIRLASDGAVWIHASKRVGGFSGEQRLALPPAAADFVAQMNRLDEFQIDPSGRFWFFQRTASYAPGNPGYRAGRTPASAGAWYDGRTLQPFALGTAIGYRAPRFAPDGSFWHATDMMVYRRPPMPSAQAVFSAPAQAGPLSERRQEAGAGGMPARAPRETLVIDGESYTLYYGELHTHLSEYPGDREIEFWTDRYYLNAMQSGVLDFGATSDHDWPSMTNSKYRVEQAYAKVLSAPGRFAGFSSYEWSGNAAGRRRYGDRTIVFSRPYSPIFRITDPASNEVEELHRLLAGENAIDWAHHVGAPWGVMDWSKHDPVAEPVMEIVSGHGVYETYDKSRAVPDWLRRPPVGKSSIQDGLAYGKKFGFVGSSDRHDGISGYDTGMFGVFAKELSRESVIEALRSRRSFAVRGGEPLLLDFRVNGVFQGGDAAVGSAPPHLSVKVKARSAVEKIEVVRNGAYIFTHVPEGATTSAAFDYRDTAGAEPGTYYYVRVRLKGRQPILQPGRGDTGKYAWSSPVWIAR